jgi:hypothetical protein
MRIAMHCLAISVLLLLPAYNALSYDYTWDDYRKPFTQLVKVPLSAQGTSTVYLDLPQELLNSHQSLTLQLDIESNASLDIQSQKNFRAFNPYCSVNGAVLFWRHRIPVDVLPARQNSSISLSTKDLKAGRNTLEFSMQDTMPVNWQYGGDRIVIIYGIHKMWFSEFSSSSQQSTIEKVKDVQFDNSKPYDVYLVKAVSTSPLDSRGNKCGEATATLYVQGNVAKGTGKTSWGDSFEASGSVDSTGRVNVGIASGSNVFGTFTGVVSGDSASGIWQDKFQCYGTWTATQKVETPTKPGGMDIEAKLMELKQLLDQGLINQQDYDRKKKELLDQL